ncbi:MAG: hypothetical protein ACJ72C_02705 [Nitrososphaeraceae archaeon]
MEKTLNIIRLLQGTKQIVRISGDNNNWIQDIMALCLSTSIQGMKVRWNIAK